MVGAADLRPGEASLAHHGVLFLDEFPEFRRDVREALRAPLEDRVVVLARAGGRVVFPANFALVAAANPCPCGYWGHPTRPCLCSPSQRQRYRASLSGPIVDRVDMRVELRPVEPARLFEGPGSEASEGSHAVRERVERCRLVQSARNGPGRTNASLGSDEVLQLADPRECALRELVRHVEKRGTSARGARRLLRVSRTIADLGGAERVETEHIRAAISLRFDSDEEVVP